MTGDREVPGSNPARTVGFFSEHKIRPPFAHLHPCASMCILIGGVCSILLFPERDFSKYAARRGDSNSFHRETRL